MPLIRRRVVAGARPIVAGARPIKETSARHQRVVGDCTQSYGRATADHMFVQARPKLIQRGRDIYTHCIYVFERGQLTSAGIFWKYMDDGTQDDSQKEGKTIGKDG